MICSLENTCLVTDHSEDQVERLLVSTLKSDWSRTLLLAFERENKEDCVLKQKRPIFLSPPTQRKPKRRHKLRENNPRTFDCSSNQLYANGSVVPPIMSCYYRGGVVTRTTPAGRTTSNSPSKRSRQYGMGQTHRDGHTTTAAKRTKIANTSISSRSHRRQQEQQQPARRHTIAATPSVPQIDPIDLDEESNIDIDLFSVDVRQEDFSAFFHRDTAASGGSMVPTMITTYTSSFSYSHEEEEEEEHHEWPPANYYKPIETKDRDMVKRSTLKRHNPVERSKADIFKLIWH